MILYVKLLNRMFNEVAVSHLDGVLVGEEMDDLKGMGDNSDSQELLAVVATVHHKARKKIRVEISARLRAVVERKLRTH